MVEQDVPLRPRDLAGYRVLRGLTRDEATETVLGFEEPRAQPTTEAADTSDAGDRADHRAEPRLVTITVLPSTPDSWQMVSTWIMALDRAAGDHVVRLVDLDVDSDASGEVVCVVFERFPRGDLRELLHRRDHLPAGEAVTLLAPLAQAVIRLHAAGVAHGALSARTIVFRQDGTPVLTGFRSARLFPAGAPEVVRERESGVIADRRALRELASTVLSRVDGSRARAARELMQSLEAAPDDVVPELIADGIFQLASALPVSFATDPKEAPAAVSCAIPIGVVTAFSDPGELSRGASIVSRLAGFIPEPWVSGVIDSEVARSLARARHWFDTRPPRIRRLVLAGGASTVAVLLALTAVPTTSRPAAPDTLAPVIARPTPSPAQRSALVDPDDPLAAAHLLLAARRGCFRSLSIGCLDAVDAVDSGALRDDRERIRSAQRGAEVDDPLSEVAGEAAAEVVERLGDSALIRLGSRAASAPSDVASAGDRSEPASLLVVKSEAGWRIRDVFEGAPDETAVRRD
jgi:serine/threonine protein kinase